MTRKNKATEIARSMYLAITNEFEHEFTEEKIIKEIRLQTGKTVRISTLRKWCTDWSADWREAILQRAKQSEVLRSSDALTESIEKLGKSAVGKLAKQMNRNELENTELIRIIGLATKHKNGKTDKSEDAELIAMINNRLSGMRGENEEN
jgi:hypothetical protein